MGNILGGGGGSAGGTGGGGGGGLGGGGGGKSTGPKQQAPSITSNLVKSLVPAIGQAASAISPEFGAGFNAGLGGAQIGAGFRNRMEVTPPGISPARYPGETRPAIVIPQEQLYQPRQVSNIGPQNPVQSVTPTIQQKAPDVDIASPDALRLNLSERRPVTYYSTGGAVGGPDERQDKWTNRGYTSTGQNLSPGVVAVGSDSYPLGTILKDPDTGEVFIAADRSARKRSIDIYEPPEDYSARTGSRNFNVIGREKVPGSVSGIQALLNKYRGL